MRLSEATVLVVDDEAELLEIFAAWLERCGCRVIAANNGAEALDVLLRKRVDALVSDIRMPIMDGVTLLRSMQEHQVTIPSIILVSGFGDVERREMHALGVERLLEKPLRRQHLIETLERSLKDRSELWLTPSALPVDQILTLRLQSTGDPGTDCGFRLGRGGCCVPSDRPLTEDKTIELAIEFCEETMSLRAQGEVEWYNPDCSCVGIAFEYVDPACRGWLLSQIADRQPRSFIPQCGTESPATGSFFRPSSLPTWRIGATR